MTEALTYKGEALLLSWSDSAAGRKVTFLLPEDGKEHPFRDYKSGPKYGQAFAIGCAPIDYDNPEPAKPGDPVKSVAGYAKPPMTESQRCGMLCGDAAFQVWLSETFPGRWDAEADRPENGHDGAKVAAATLRQFLNIKSRRELDHPDCRSIDLWLDLRSNFERAAGRMAEKTR